MLWYTEESNKRVGLRYRKMPKRSDIYRVNFNRLGFYLLEPNLLAPIKERYIYFAKKNDLLLLLEVTEPNDKRITNRQHEYFRKVCYVFITNDAKKIYLSLDEINAYLVKVC